MHDPTHPEREFQVEGTATGRLPKSDVPPVQSVQSRSEEGHRRRREERVRLGSRYLDSERARTGTDRVLKPEPGQPVGLADYVGAAMFGQEAWKRKVKRDRRASALGSAVRLLTQVGCLAVVGLLTVVSVLSLVWLTVFIWGQLT